ncbi:MAG: TetR/AcrR family transcriptional regulator [Pseudomonadota bacterium]
MNNLHNQSPDAVESPSQAGSSSPKNEKLRREDWIAAARQALIKDGITGISLRRLAASLGATTGAFYWQYKRLEELMEDVREDWVHRNTDKINRAIAQAGPDGWQMYLAYTRALIIDDAIDARYENAVREWAHSSKRTADVLKRVEEMRVEQLRSVFLSMGFEGKAALIRARVMYFHQTGYYAMQIEETMEERLANVPYYAEILADRLDLLDFKNAADVKRFLEENTKPCGDNTG